MPVRHEVAGADHVSEEELARRVARATFVTRLFLVALASLLVGAILVIVVLVGQIRSTQVSNTARARNDAETLVVVQQLARQINSCVTPGKPCYQDGQKRTTQALGQLQHIITLAAACALEASPSSSLAQREAAISDCITKGLT